MFKRSMRCIFLLLIFLGAQIIHIYGWEIDQTSSVTSIVDGDTFYIPGDRVRLADIDAPESGNEPGYSQAKNALTNLIGGKTVYLDTDQQTGRDPYGRLVAVVYIIANSTHYLNVNKALLEQVVVVLDDFTNNEFNPSTWTLYVRYAYPPTPPPPTPPPPTPPPTPPPEPPPTPPPTSYILIISTQGLGTTNPAPATYSYNEGTYITVEQNPSEDWMFSHWLLDNVTRQEKGPITITLNKNHDLVAVFIEKPPDCKITFKTTDTLGRNIEGVIIKSNTQPGKEQAIELTTNATGETVTDLIYYGYYVFSLSKHGYDSITKEVNLDSGEQSEVIVSLSEAAVNLSLTVQDSEGALLENVTVSSIVQPSGQAPIKGVTDQSGTVVFRDIKPGSYSFKLSSLWVKEEIKPISVNLGEASQSYRTTVQRLCGLRVCVVDEQGKRIEGVKVESLATPPGQVTLTGVCDGELLFNDLMPGSYAIRFSKEGYTPVNHSVTLGAGFLNDAKLVVLIKPLSTIISENLFPILSLVAMVGVSAYFVSIKIRSKPVTTISSLVANPAPVAQVASVESVLAEPKYFGDAKGMIIKAIAVDEKHDLSEIKKQVNLPEEEFMRAFYELLKTNELLGTDKGTFNVKKETRDQWIRYYQSKN